MSEHQAHDLESLMHQRVFTFVNPRRYTLVWRVWPRLVSHKGRFRLLRIYMVHVLGVEGLSVDNFKSSVMIRSETLWCSCKARTR